MALEELEAALVRVNIALGEAITNDVNYKSQLPVTDTYHICRCSLIFGPLYLGHHKIIQPCKASSKKQRNHQGGAYAYTLAALATKTKNEANGICQ